MTPDDIRQEIELKVVELIKSKLTDGTMTEERSRQLSQMVLDILKPGISMEELYKAIFTLDDNASELSGVVLPYAKQYEYNVTQKTVDIVKNYIHVGKYDAAVNLAKRAIKNDVMLEWQGNGKKSSPTKPPEAVNPPTDSAPPVHEQKTPPASDETPTEHTQSPDTLATLANPPEPVDEPEQIEESPKEQTPEEKDQPSWIQPKANQTPPQIGA